ncbi:EthD family reductase [Lactonifactor longoviformis]|uniref:EthD domain-containing protein n=1 Tax=Lactonifactor longoviformis DSM 17459 TaxID=1122155 RepID=A0A1M4URH5_9CLOT|nr:EthD family reductase [Lactonifactor longoviformis]SHE59351.1 conserved hypothetical protein [Lactonifactor longoviformis DSM 17459]
MVIFQIMYPYGEDRRFDIEYYLKSHLVNAKKLLGKACLKVEVTRGFKEFYQDTTPFFAFSARLVFENEETFFKAYTEDVDTFLMEDIPRFTDIAPVWQLEEIVYQETSI